MTTEQKAALSYSPFETIRTPDGKIDHSFGPYSETREHLDGWLPKLLQNIGVSDGLNVELGSGRGHSGEYILPYVAITGRMIMSEPDADGYKALEQKFGGDSRVEVRNKSALEMLEELEDGSVDRIYYLNAIHLDDDREKVVELAFKKLKAGGLFIANSSFIYESEPASEIPMYKRWMMRARRLLKAEYPQLYEELNGKRSIRMNRKPKSHYDEIIKKAGFVLRDLEPYGLAFDQSGSQLQNSFVGLFRIAQYWIWIQGTIHVVNDDEQILREELEIRLDIITQFQQRALLEVYPQITGVRISPRNNAIWVAEKGVGGYRRKVYSSGVREGLSSSLPHPVSVKAPTRELVRA